MTAIICSLAMVFIGACMAIHAIKLLNTVPCKHEVTMSELVTRRHSGLVPYKAVFKCCSCGEVVDIQQRGDM